MHWYSEIMNSVSDWMMYYPSSGSCYMGGGSDMPERPHSRKKTVEEGTVEVKKGEQVKESVQAGDGLAFSKESNNLKEDDPKK